MFVVIYSFHVKSGQVRHFEKAWREMTVLIYTYGGSLGSRLHKKNELHYIAYAQWPDKSTWGYSGDKLPEVAKGMMTLMRDACEQIEVLFELEVVEDLLEKK